MSKYANVICGTRKTGAEGLNLLGARRVMIEPWMRGTLNSTEPAPAKHRVPELSRLAPNSSFQAKTRPRNRDETRVY